ncbi:MAG: ATP-binding protein [Acidobacteria bacterium]|nr:ATP-binding protein [Acidobacteriota bacterium]MCA1620377.1 ATP-binding protein [Acidobacteriota bacterium]
MRVFHTQDIKDEAQVGTARRGVHRFASRLGFSDDRLSEIDIVVQEMGTNAARYATSGGCLHWGETLGDEPGIELFYFDKGPGIYDLDRALRDGVSSGGSIGGGFGAMRRLLDEFDAYSTVKGTTRRLTTARRSTHGTALLGRKWVAPPADDERRERARRTSRRLGAWSRPRPSEDANGDAYFVKEHGGETLLAVVDGLGHGRGAREAAAAAVEVLELWRGEPLDELTLGVHDALRATRGAVMGAVAINPARETFAYAGVGNVEVRVLGAADPARPIPTNGTLGARLSSVRVWPHRWAEGSTLVIASDGISATWDPAAYPGLAARSPQLLAGVLLRDFVRNSDDATVLVYR